MTNGLLVAIMWEFSDPSQQRQLQRASAFLADRTNGRAYATVLRLSVVVCLWRYVLWLNGAS